MDSVSSNKRMKIVGAVLAAALLVVVGVVAVNNGAQEAQMMPLEHAQAIAKTAHASTPLSNLPDESALETPQGWTIESDEPVDEGSNVDEVTTEDSDGLEENAVEEDEDMDSPFQIEEDKEGEKFVAELDPEVIVEGDDENEAGAQVAGDAKKKSGCYKNLKACGAKKSCSRKCSKKCHPYAIRKCKPKKFCRCFCKYYGNVKKARRCVIYRRKLCKKGVQYRCKRTCAKFCKKVPHCYCCPKTHIRRKCRKLCRRFLYRSKCGKCRCYKVRCYKTCRFVCSKKY